MKTILLLAFLLPTLGFSQTVRTSIAAGDFINPLNWSPIGLPTSGDSLIINHDMVMTTDIYYTAGRITINSSGSLIEDLTDRSFWADGDGSLVNYGTFTAHLLLVSPNADLINYGNFSGVDSVWNQGNLLNAGSMESFDFLNDETGSFDNSGSLLINNNMNNQGYATNQAAIVLVNDFSNCNTQTLDAMFINNGRFCIGNDFLNCIDDTLKGNGSYYISGLSSNFGVFDGTHIFYTSNGTVGIPGNIQAGVIVAQGSCNLGLETSIGTEYSVSPNPTSSDISLTVSDVGFKLYDVTGKIVSEGIIINYSIEMNNLNKGIYVLNVEGKGTKRIIKK